MSITAYPAAKGREGKPYPGSDTESTRTYHVFTDSYSQTEFDILFAGVLPLRGSQHPESPILYAFDLNLKQNDQRPTMWLATIKYKPDTFPQREKDKQALPNPLDRPAEIEWGSVAYNVPIDHDLDGRPVVNSAGDYWDPPPEMIEYYWCAHTTRNVSVVPLWVIDYAGAVNNTAYMLDGLMILEECSRLVDLKIGIRQRENGVPYRQLRMSIELRKKRKIRTGEAPNDIPSPFDLEMLDQGFHTWDPATSKPKRIYTADIPKQPTAQPVLLDGAGNVLADPTIGTAHYRQFRITGREDFSVLPLT